MNTLAQARLARDAQGWQQLDSINKERFYVDGYPLCGWTFGVNLIQPKLRCESCAALREVQEQAKQPV